MLDRDFVLTLESDAAQSFCVHTSDGDQHAAVASIRIPPVDAKNDKPLAVKLLIDCSGSMGGTSITQARKAALEILNALSPTDSFNVTLFGSDCKHIFPRMVPASGQFITQAWERLEHLDADMGGTEMEKALAATFAIGGSESPPCVLLITDGEIQEHAKLVRFAAKSAHRIFTVGVGSAVVDVFLESLARTTGGACELVSPQEGMAEKILSQFHRLRQPKLEQVQIDWPATPDWSTPLPKTVFAGDTVHVFAGFKQAINDSVTLRTAVTGLPITVTTAATASKEKELTRIAAAHRIKSATKEQALALSLKYQLLSQWTSYLVIAERDVKANDLPQLHQVPQMLAAGWAGTGTVANSRPSVSASYSLPQVTLASRLRGPAPMSCPSIADSYGFGSMDEDIPFDINPSPKASAASPARAAPKVASSSAFSATRSRVWATSPKQFIERLEAAVRAGSLQQSLPMTLAELDALGLEKVLSDEIRKLIDYGYHESGLVIAFLHALFGSKIGNLFDRALKRLILKRWKDLAPAKLFNEEMAKVVKNIKHDAWGLNDDDSVPS